MRKILMQLLTAILLCTFIIISAIPAFASAEAPFEIYDWEDYNRAVDKLCYIDEVFDMRADIELLEQKEILRDNMYITFRYNKHFIDRCYIHSGSTNNRFFTIYGDNITLDFGEKITVGSMNRNNVNGACLRIIGDNCTIKNANIDSCRAVNGGAIYVEGDDCVFENCRFYGCSSIEDGGAIYIEGYNAKIINCKFFDCSSEEDGGAIYVNDDAVIENCYFENCYAEEDGGAICDGNSVGDVYIRNCSFENCGCGGNGKWVDCNGDAWIDGCQYGTDKEYYDCDEDKFDCDEKELEPLGPYKRPYMSDYARAVMTQKEYCDVIVPDLSSEALSTLEYFVLYGTPDNGIGWMIDYENPLTITAQEGYTIQRIEAIVEEGKQNYAALSVDNGTKNNLFNDPYYSGNAIEQNKILQIDDINSDSVTFTTDGNIYDNKAMHISDVIVYFSNESDEGAFAGSALSGGSLAIITAAAGLAIGVVSGIAIGKKSKKAATTEENTVEEE